MRQISDDIVHLGCIRLRSSEEIEVRHKKLKVLLNTPKEHIETLAPQLLRPDFFTFEALDEHCE